MSNKIDLLESDIKVVKLSDLYLCDPSTALIKGSTEYYTLNNYSMKKISELFNLKNNRFSSNLYNINQEVWKILLDKNMSLNSVIESISDYSVLIINDEVVTVVQGNSYFDNVIKSIESYSSDKSLFTNITVHDQVIIMTSVNSDGYGILIRYYIDTNWIVANDCYFNVPNQEIILAPKCSVDAEVTQDVEDLLNKDLLIASSISTLPYQIDDYKSRLSEVKMSVDEFKYFTKKFFKLKLNLENPSELISDYLSEKQDWNRSISENFSDLIKKYYSSTSSSLVNSAFLKRAVNFTEVTYREFSKILELMFISDMIDISDLISFQSKAILRDTHFNQLNS